MQLKTFQAADIRSALAAVKQELGPEALVVATRTIPGGILSSSRVEVTAAIEPAPALKIAQSTIRHEASPEALPLQRLGHLAGERRYAEGQRHESRSVTAGLDDAGLQIANRLTTQLVDADVEPDLAQRLGSIVARRCGPSEDESVYTRTLCELVADRLGQVHDPCHGHHVKVAVVGATGVGKTTTIAKIAAHAALVLRKQVALVSVDTYRVGALEQLRAYADLIQVPLTIARDAASFGKAIRTHANADLVLIDTAGRGPQDAEQVPTLTAMFAGYDVRTCLAVAANTRRYEVRRVLERYRPLSPSAVLLTKLDESEVGGAVLNVTTGGPLPLSYVTFGQRVPEDIARAEPKSLAEFVLAAANAAAGFMSWAGMAREGQENPS